MKYLYSLLLCMTLLAHAAAAETVSNGGINVHFDSKDSDLAAASLGWLVEAASEFETRLPLGDEPVNVYIAHTLPEFKERAGTMGSLDVSGIARPWRGEIVVKAPHIRMTGGDYRGTLRHELIHILLFRNSNTDVMPAWLNEGTCMMLANEYRWSSTISVAKMFMENRIIPYRFLDRAFRAPQSGMQFGDAYAQALSMTRYLHDEIGEEQFWALLYGLKDDTFADAMLKHTDISITLFWNAYSGSLWRVALIGTLSSGSLFGPAAILVIIVWYRKRRINRKTLDRWEIEEAIAPPEEIFYWDAVAEDPDAWKNKGDSDDSDPRY